MNGPRETKSVTHHVPAHLFEAFLQNATEFLQNARGGKTAQQRALEVRAQDKDAGLDSLAFLLEFTRGSSGQAGTVARFLAGLYNGSHFPFDLTDLRGIDPDLFEHCMAVLRLDQKPDVEIHNYIPDGSARFLQLLQDWNLVKRPAPPPSAEWYNATYSSYGNAPGYRAVSLFVQLAGEDGAPPGERIELNFSAADSADILRDIMGVHKFAWGYRNGRDVPLDIKPGEQRPRWLP